MIGQCFVHVAQGSVLGRVSTFGWIPVYVALAVQFLRIRRWDQAWRERWERRHRQPLERFHEKGESWLSGAACRYGSSAR